MVEFNVLTLKKDMGFAKIEIHPVLIKDDADLILFDAGFPNQLKDFEIALDEINYTIFDLTKIVISHHDHDHIGSLQDIKRANPKIKIVTTTIESKYISGKKLSLRIIQAQEYNANLTGEKKIFGEQFAEYLKSIKTCNVDIYVDDGDYISKGVKVIKTPGHTPGHISLLIEEKKTLLAGDALAIEDQKIVIANPEFTLDKNEALKSIRKIREMNLDSIICYHGHTLNGSINEKLELLLHKNEMV